MSITLQNGRESNQEGLSKQIVSVTPPLVKQPQSQWQQRIQDFKDQMRMPPVGTESMQSAPPKGTESVKATLTKKEDNVRATPLRGIKSMQNTSPYNTESQQPLYLKEILTREPGEE